MNWYVNLLLPNCTHNFLNLEVNQVHLISESKPASGKLMMVITWVVRGEGPGIIFKWIPSNNCYKFISNITKLFEEILNMEASFFSKPLQTNQNARQQNAATFWTTTQQIRMQESRLWPENRKKMMAIFVVKAWHNADKLSLFIFEQLGLEDESAQMLAYS